MVFAYGAGSYVVAIEQHWAEYAIKMQLKAGGQSRRRRALRITLAVSAEEGSGA
jgi:hypothetical protein